MIYEVDHPPYPGTLIYMPASPPWFTYPATSMSLALERNGHLRHYEGERYSPTIFVLPDTPQEAIAYFLDILHHFDGIEQNFGLQQMHRTTPDDARKELYFHLYWEPPSGYESVRNVEERDAIVARHLEKQFKRLQGHTSADI